MGVPDRLCAAAFKKNFQCCYREESFIEFNKNEFICGDSLDLQL
jgi:hypothetical protein